MTNEHVLQGTAPKIDSSTQDTIRRSEDSPSMKDADLDCKKEAFPEEKSHPVDSSSEPSGQDIEAGGRKAVLKSRARHYYSRFGNDFWLAVIWLLFTG